MLLTSLTKEPTTNDRKVHKEVSSTNISIDSLQLTYKLAETKNQKAKFKQSVGLIKLLYEKVLDLDHHFSSMDISHKVTKLANPHTYPEFQELQKAIKNKQKQRQKLDLPPVLESNFYVSATAALVEILSGQKKKGAYKEEIEKTACILDFTLKMNSELNTIYYETEYLKNSNQKLMKECEMLFQQCMEVIGYNYSLTHCRNSDDWERLFELLDRYIESIEKDIMDNTSLNGLSKEEIDLQFAIDRVIAFIQSYNDFIAQGDNYYKKFSVIISNYRNQEFCGNSLPQEFHTLKADIGLTIEKFNNSYNLPELRGSKLKELMYGVGS